MSLIDRAKNMIMSPKTEWQAVAAEEPNVAGIITGYVIPLLLIPAVASFIGYGFIGLGFIKSTSWGLYHGVTQFVLGLIGVYITAMVVNMLAPSFGSEKNMGRAMQLIAYSYTPMWVFGILYIIPTLSFIPMLAGIYSLYVLYLGLPVTMKTPQDKVIIYLIVSIVVLFLVYFIVGAILAAILLPIFGLSILSSIRTF
jgi:hypothetical protein